MGSQGRQLVCSNVFMTFDWYGHLNNYNDKPRIIG
ncbi:MAG: DMT family protein [Candidatus Omnitrophota bacterium]|nr:DMT family protein [Candidatus Omnitrophota bacterium]